MQDHEIKKLTEKEGLLSRKMSNHQAKESGKQQIVSPQPDPVQQVVCRTGDNSCAQAHASTLNRATAGRPDLSAKSLLQLQRQYGNRYVQRVLALAKKGDRETEAAPDVEQSIQQARGGGQALDSGVRAQMESSFGADFSGVRVHTGADADVLNRSLNSRAFTTGQDIFFKEDAYSPGSSGGRELLAHELTHVVQQTGDEVRRKLTVGQPGDRYEQEADQVARAVIQQEAQPIQEDADEKLVQRQVEEEEEEEEPLQAKAEDPWVQRQVPEEEEEEAVP